MRHLINASVLLLFLCYQSCSSTKREDPQADFVPDPQLAELKQHIVVSSSPYAIAAGESVLNRGGNAFDAAVAVAAMLSVTEPQHSGLGGYGSTLIFDAAEGKAKFLSFSGKYPQKLNREAFVPPTRGYQQNRQNAKSIVSPMALSGWYALHEKYGQIPWPDLFQESIETARKGYPVDVQLAKDITDNFERFNDYSRSFYGNSGSPLKAGDLLQQSDLARTLQEVSAKGSVIFANSSDVAQSVVATVDGLDGFLSNSDLQAMEAQWYDPISINFNGYEIVSTGAPTAGFVALQSIGEAGLYDLNGIGHNTLDYLHIFQEVSKHAYWTFLRYAGSIDTILPNFTTVLSPRYWQWMAQNIRPDSAVAFYPPFDFEYVDPASNTTHFVIADQYGNVVSTTASLGDVFGSAVMAPGTGIWLNNGAKYAIFDQKGTPRDAIPGRERVTMDSPLMVFKDGRPTAAMGTPGGNRMPQSVAQAVLNYCKFNYPLSSAIALPMIAFERDSLLYENGIDEQSIQMLRSMGHKVKSVPGVGQIQALEVRYDAAGKRTGYFSASESQLP